MHHTLSHLYIIEHTLGPSLHYGTFSGAIFTLQNIPCGHLYIIEHTLGLSLGMLGLGALVNEIEIQVGMHAF